MCYKKVLFFCSIFLLLFASGCVKNCKPEDYSNFVAIADSPSEGSVISYKDVPTFSWHNNIGCKPKKYRIFVDNQYTGHVFVRDLDGSETDLTSADILEVFQPTRDMAWYIVAYGENSAGPFVSNLIHFQTDGFCEPNELVIPVPVEPENEKWLNKPWANLTWLYPGNCVPESYGFELAADPEFTNIVYSGEQDRSHIKMGPITQNGHTISKIASGVNVAIPQCARLYWRIEAKTGQSSSGFSDPFRFTYALDYSCWQNEVSIDAALIRGFVFEDICEYTKPFESESSQILPPCDSSEFGIHADSLWEVYDASEPGISQIKVNLGAGPCPSTGLDEFITLSNGMYYFMVQAPGEYCVSVSKLENPSLEDGIWTRPLTDQAITQQTLTFGPNDTKKTQDFGWDKNDFKKLNFKITKLTTCRKHDYKNSPAVMYLEEGSLVPVIATNDENTWFLTLFDCFVSLATGQPEPGDLPLYPEQPLPIPIEVSGPDPEPDPEPERDCSDFTTPRSCPHPRCVWDAPAGVPGSCKDN